MNSGPAQNRSRLHHQVQSFDLPFQGVEQVPDGFTAGDVHLKGVCPAAPLPDGLTGIFGRFHLEIGHKYPDPLPTQGRRPTPDPGRSRLPRSAPFQFLVFKGRLLHKV